MAVNIHDDPAEQYVTTVRLHPLDNASQHLRVAPFLGEDAGANQRAGELATEAKTANEEGDDRKMFIALRTKIYAEARDGYVHIDGESSLNLIAN